MGDERDLEIDEEQADEVAGGRYRLMRPEAESNEPGVDADAIDRRKR